MGTAGPTARVWTGSVATPNVKMEDGEQASDMWDAGWRPPQEFWII